MVVAVLVFDALDVVLGGRRYQIVLSSMLCNQIAVLSDVLNIYH